MSIQRPKQNSLLTSNFIKIKSLKTRKYKSLENKPNKNPFLNISLRSSSKENSKNLQNYETDTPEFGLDKKRKFFQGGVSKNAYAVRWRQKRLSFKFSLDKSESGVAMIRPLIQKSSKIPEVFFKAINQDRKPFHGLTNLIQARRIQNDQCKQKYLGEFNLKIEQFESMKNQNIGFKLNKQQLEKLKQFFPQKLKKDVNIASVGLKLKKIL